MLLQYLETFLKVSRYPSLSSASQELHLSQPALSRQIAALEEHLDVKLFKRKSSGVELTPAGLLLKERGANLLFAADQLATDLRGMDPIAPLHLGVPPGVSTDWVKQFIQTMLHNVENIRIYEADSPHQMELLRSKQLDIALSREVSNEFVQVIAYRQPLGIAFPADSREPSLHSVNRLLMNTGADAHTQTEEIRHHLDQANFNGQLITRRFDLHGELIAALENADAALITEATARRAFPRWAWMPLPQSRATLSTDIWATRHRYAPKHIREVFNQLEASLSPPA